MRLLFLCITIITIMPISYGDYCTKWNKETTIPGVTIDVLNNVQQYIPHVKNDNTETNIDSPDARHINSNFMEYIVEHGYQVEEHTVTTNDGYILRMFRIPGSNEKVVFLMHGLFGSSDDFATPGKGHALVYELAAAGYDLWFGNARGNVYSRRHTYYEPDCIKFWDFTWDEIGRIDLPAMIDYVLEETHERNLQYIGYSQGATSFFVMCSEKPEYNEKISTMIALAPVAWVSHTTNLLIQFASLFTTLYPEDTLTTFGTLFGYELLPRHNKNASVNIACIPPFNSHSSCNNLVALAFGFDNAIGDLQRVYAHFPAGISAKQLLHYGQGVMSGKFRQYDYGKDNTNNYGWSTPPEYIVERITTRVVIFQSDGDNTATNEDVGILIKRLRKFNNRTDYYKIPHKSFGHFDYIVAKDVKKLVHDEILDFLDS